MKAAPQAVGQPVAWEKVLLSSLALMDSTEPRREVGSTVVGNLLSFDCYGRAADLAKAEAAELRRPMRQAGCLASRWTLTLNPTAQSPSLQTFSKTGTRDDCVAIGATHNDREWIVKLMRPLAGMPRKMTKLLDMIVSRYHHLKALGRRLPGLGPAKPHQMRHGGASMDALTGCIQDLDMADRGRWKSLQSVRRYRKPAAYLRRLSSLSPEQRSLAIVAPGEIMRRLPSHLV